MSQFSFDSMVNDLSTPEGLAQILENTNLGS